MNYKKTIEKIEDTISCFFNTDVKFKVYESNDVLQPGGTELRQLWFKGHPIFVRSKEDFVLMTDDKVCYDSNIVKMLTTLKSYK